MAPGAGRKFVSFASPKPALVISFVDSALLETSKFWFVIEIGRLSGGTISESTVVRYLISIN